MENLGNQHTEVITVNVVLHYSLIKIISNYKFCFATILLVTVMVKLKINLQ